MPLLISTDIRCAKKLTLLDRLPKDPQSLEMNLSRACQRGALSAIADVRRQGWLYENADSINAWNDYVAEQGLPLSRFRRF
jgi:antitoxin CcdA